MGSYYNRHIVKVVAIINPISGAGADPDVAEHRRRLLAGELERRRMTAAIHLTTHAGHARALAHTAVADGAELVVAWGGDGTVNEAGAALMGSGVPLGVVPAGSGNGLAAALGSPREPGAAIARALDGPPRRIDAGTIGGRPFFNIAGIGVDARVAALFNVRAKGTRGHWPYLLLGLQQAWQYRGSAYDIELDGRTARVHALLIAFANGGEYGNGFRLSADARLDDGLLDAVVVEDRGLVARFWHARHLVRGTVDRAPRVTARRVRRAVVTAAGPLAYHVDGEPGLSESPVEILVHPGALIVKG